MNKVIKYLIAFLLGDNDINLINCVKYSEEKVNSQLAKIIIKPSTFFQKNTYMMQQSLPEFPLKEIEGVPLLFGSPRVELTNGVVTVYADIIASTFFLVTRYEEYVRRDVRDEHGRFPGRESLPYRAGFLHRPIVEEYRRLLRGWLRDAGVQINEPAVGIRHVYLTHDVDRPWQKQYSFFGALMRCMKSMIIKRQFYIGNLKSNLTPLSRDKLYQALKWLISEDAKLAIRGNRNIIDVIYFVLCCNSGKNDICYHKQKQRFRKLIGLLKEYAEVGLHVSYAAGLNPKLIKNESETYARNIGHDAVISRYHYLTCREPQDLRALIDVGITEDFTHSYADIAGFRLGTCRAVNWIDAERMELTPLILHPMTVMECTLDLEKYMGLSYEEAYSHCIMLLDAVNEYAGEVVLLWHNTSVAKDTTGYQRKLYKNIVSFINDKL